MMKKDLFMVKTEQREPDQGEQEPSMLACTLVRRKKFLL